MINQKMTSPPGIQALTQEMEEIEKESAEVKKTARQIIDQQKIKSVLNKISNT